jgi:carboxylesterase type B
MPSAAGLFHRAILQSGSLQPLHSVETAATVARELLGELWLAPTEIDALQHVPAESLLLAQRSVAQRLRTSPEWLTYRPFVDGRVLPRDPYDAIRDGAGRGIPILVGSNRDECRPLAFLDPRLRPQNDAGLHARVRVLASADVDAERIVAAYRRVAGEGADLTCLAAAVETDVHFRLPAIRFAEAQARHERRTFMYRFDWRSPALNGVLGACHGLEVPFVFGHIDAPGLSGLVGEGEAVNTLAERMMDAWTAFARSGAPGHAALPDWPAYEPALRATMRLDAPCSVDHDPGGIERRAWLAPLSDPRREAPPLRRAARPGGSRNAPRRPGS